MKIAKQLKDSNVCEYLLYMWQVEDTIRAFGCDIERIQKEYIPRFNYTSDEAKLEAEWYDDLIRMMHEEVCVESGHLQINKGTFLLVVDMHNELLKSPKHSFYSAAYYKALPYIVELRSRSGDKNESEQEVGDLETCFNALYGIMLLRLQGKPITGGTQTAVTAISHLLALLADAYKKEKLGELEL